MDKLSILFIVKAEQVTGVYYHYWTLYKYGMLECRKDVKQCSRYLMNRLIGLMAYIAKGSQLSCFYNKRSKINGVLLNYLKLHENI